MTTARRNLGTKKPRTVRPEGSLSDLPLFDTGSAEAVPASAAGKKGSASLDRSTSFKSPRKKAVPPSGGSAKRTPAAKTVPARTGRTGKPAPNRTDEPASRQATAPDPEKTPVEKSIHQTAQSMAQRQREISVSEFFAKNRHLLGFDSLTKALLTAIKEAVDNSLDACEEAGLPPDLLVEIRELAENRHAIVVEDSGPGIVKAQVPKIFGKLLYGSKFHSLKQARGQQGIGISAAGMYAQLTTGKPVRITTRTGARQQAHVYEIQIDTKKNTPIILSEQPIDWERTHGTRIEMEILATYKKGQRSVDAYLHQVAIANPHARIVYRPPRDPEVVYSRLSPELPAEPRSIKPHPHGVELGVLMDMLKATRARNLKSFLTSEFSRMSARLAQEVIDRAELKPTLSPKRVTRDETEKLIASFARTRIMKPPTNCLSVIGQELLAKSISREIEADFVTAVTRPPAVYRGNPFQVEIALAYGGKLPEDEIVQLYRFANRAPLIYQQAGCATTHAVLNTAWRSYGVQQPRGALPVGPLAIVVHIASVWVPFTSESKESIAHYPEIIKEIKLALQECGRNLARYIRRGVREREEAKKRTFIEKYIPHIGIALKEILSFSDKEEQRVVDKLVAILERSRKN